MPCRSFLQFYGQTYRLTCWSALLVCCLFLAFMSGCKKRISIAERDYTNQPKVTAKDIRSNLVVFDYALYTADLATRDQAEQALLSLLEKEPYSRFAVTEDITRRTTAPSIQIQALDASSDQFAVPNPEILKYFGIGLLEEEISQVAAAKGLLLVSFAWPNSDDYKLLLTATALMGQITQVDSASGDPVSWLWDAETRQMFSPAAWHEQRILTWQNATIPDASANVTIHAYRINDLIRIITLGMAKFGLPDLAFESLPASSQSDAAYILNATAQAMVEGQLIGDNSCLTLNLQTLKHAEATQRYQEIIRENGTGLATLTFRKARKDKGDPTNLVFEITGEAYADEADDVARLQRIFTNCFGRHYEIIESDHDQQDLIAASNEARKQIPALQARFQEGLHEGEMILVKAPFVEGNKKEYMWLEVINWEEDSITGVLLNQPSSLASVGEGQKVQIKQQEVFDYLHIHPDGTSSGNTTSKILQSRLESGR